MIGAVIGQDDRVARFVASIPPFDPSRGFGLCTAIGWAEDGELIGGTVFHNYDGKSGVIELSTAALSARWLTRKSLQLMFGYPFSQLHCQMVVLRVSERNARMRAIARRYGFDEFIIPRLRGRNENECIYTLTDDQWQAHPLTRRHNG